MTQGIQIPDQRQPGATNLHSFRTYIQTQIIPMLLRAWRRVETLEHGSHPLDLTLCSAVGEYQQVHPTWKHPLSTLVDGTDTHLHPSI